jgi:tetratricopeptide (TPR) repeat protein
MGNGPFLAVAFYAVTLSPILGFLYWSLMNRTFVQDHYQYVACIGPFLLLTHGVEKYAPRIFRKAPHPRLLAYAALTLALVVPLGIIANLHVRLYHNAETLFRESYKRYPKAPEVAATYSYALICEKRIPEALAPAEEAIAVAPDKAVHWKRKGDILWLLKKMEEARPAYEKALALNPDYPGVVSSYAATFVYSDTPLPQAAFEMLNKAVQREPDDQYLQGTLGLAYYQQGKADDAAKHLEIALRLDEVQPAPEVLYVYGKIWLERGNTAKALPWLKRAAAADKTSKKYADALLQAETTAASGKR